jgi:hypothetical protein
LTTYSRREVIKLHIDATDMVKEEANKRSREACRERVKGESGIDKAECGVEHQRNAGASQSDFRDKYIADFTSFP